MESSQNLDPYLAPDGYYETTKSRPPHELLARAIELLGDGIGLSALDMGCGAGTDTVLLAEKGFEVTALDAKPEAGAYVARLPHQERIHFTSSKFETFKFDHYDLVNAFFALPFTAKDEFDGMMARLVASIKPGGLFVGNLFGVNDEWNKPDELMTFVDGDQAKSYFSAMDIKHFEEIDEIGQLANGKAKHWHRFDIIAKKTVTHKL